MDSKQIAKQLGERSAAAMNYGGKAVHALLDTILLTLAWLLATLVGLCLLGVGALATRPSYSKVERTEPWSPTTVHLNCDSGALPLGDAATDGEL